MGAETAHQALKEKLLQAALAHVPFDGWTRAALAAGAKDCGIAPALVLDLFPGGPSEALRCWSRAADRRMVEALGTSQLAAMKTRQRIAAAVRLRLEQNAPHREAIRRGLAFLGLPQNLALGVRLLYRTVDAIWYAVGDRSTDHNFYTKRGLLAGVYASTALYWVNDKSEGSAATWGFLDRRLTEVLRVPQALGRLGHLAARLPDPFRLFRS